MYLSKLRLRHWRIYSEANFEFAKPHKDKPVVLIGAKNGHGKTSFIMALYIGLFGKYGIQYCENFRNKDEKELKTMSQALNEFRRIGTPCHEPTEIELAFKSPSGSREETRILRRWHFDRNNKLKQGDDFDEVEIHYASESDFEPQLLEIDKNDGGRQSLEQFLFPAHLTPAFFFDGEQAAELIGDMGGKGMIHATEVMYGAEMIRETVSYLKSYILQVTRKIGGKKIPEQLQTEKKSIEKEISQLEIEHAKHIKDQDQELNELNKQKANRKNITLDINRLGGQGIEITKLQKRYEQSEKEEQETFNKLRSSIFDIGLSLAIFRFKDMLITQIEKERLREDWVNLKNATRERAEDVLSIALPHPQSEDNLLCNLSQEAYDNLKKRFTEALVTIYDPPPPEMAEHYILDHAKGETRVRLKDLVDSNSFSNTTSLKDLAEQYRKASRNKHDCEEKLKYEEGRPQEINQLTEKLDEINNVINKHERKIGELNNAISTITSDLSIKVKRLKEIVSRMDEIAPEFQRVRIAESTVDILEEFNEKLGTVCEQRLQSSVEHYFRKIADERFKEGTINLSSKNQSPSISTTDNNVLPIASGSGFERRSFSIAFCLALAEITGRRIPLVIDTPVGNADGEYRKRALQALSRFKNTDQIIILTHDEEVRLPFLEAIENHINQKMLVQFDLQTRESTILYDQFFEFNQ